MQLKMHDLLSRLPNDFGQLINNWYGEIAHSHVWSVLVLRLNVTIEFDLYWVWELSKSYQPQASGQSSWPSLLAAFSRCLHTDSSTCPPGPSPIRTSMTPQRVRLAPQDPGTGGWYVWPGRRWLPNASSSLSSWDGRRTNHCRKNYVDRCVWINRPSGKAISSMRLKQINSKWNSRR